MSKFKIGQKVTISEGFYAPVNGYIVRVENTIIKNDLSASLGIDDYIRRCSIAVRYDVVYEQKGFMDKIEKRRDLSDDKIESGWHGMKSNGDPKEFEKFGVKVPGFNL